MARSLSRYKKKTESRRPHLNCFHLLFIGYRRNRFLLYKKNTRRSKKKHSFLLAETELMEIRTSSSGVSGCFPPFVLLICVTLFPWFYFDFYSASICNRLVSQQSEFDRLLFGNLFVCRPCDSLTSTPLYKKGRNTCCSSVGQSVYSITFIPLPFRFVSKQRNNKINKYKSSPQPLSQIKRRRIKEKMVGG